MSGNIYEQNTSFSMPSFDFSPDSLAINQTRDAEKLSKNAEKERETARDMYQKDISVEASNGMNELFVKHGNDPITLEKEFSKLESKISGSIPLPDIRVGFRADMAIKKQTYINQARNNFKKLQYKQLKSASFNKIGDNSSLLGMSFANLLTNDATPDDFVNYQRSVIQNNQLINSLNDDGSFMFSDAERDRMEKNDEKTRLNAMKNTFNAMQPYEKAQFYNKLQEDDISVLGELSEKDGQKEIKPVNIKGFVQSETYDSFKDYAKNIMEKAKVLQENGVALTPEEAQRTAMTQTINNDMYKEMFNNKDTGLKSKGSMYDILEYRSGILNKFNANELSQKDYATRMGETIEPLLLKVKNDSPGNPVWWNKSFDTAILAIQSKTNLKDESDDVKAYVYDLTYSMFKEAEIDPDERYGKNDVAIEKIVSTVSQDFLKNKNPSLVGVEANKVLLGTKVFDYKTTSPKRASGGNYKLMRDEKGNVFKVYKDKEGKFSNNSIVQRIIK